MGYKKDKIYEVDEAELWLRENDPLYFEAFKRKKEGPYYLSCRQMRRVHETEFASTAEKINYFN